MKIAEMEDNTRFREGKAEEDVDYGLMKRNALLQRSHSYSHLHQENIIYRVPPLLRGTEGAFDPLIVPIGPYHREMKCVLDMKEHKRSYLSSLLSRKSPRGALFEDLAKQLAEIEGKTRRCYHENVNMCKNEFVEMMCLDGCFIVELLLRIVEKKSDELLTGPMWRPRSILRDILLLENQLPFFVLKEIFMFIKPNEDPTQLVGHCLQIFDMYKQWRNSKMPPTRPDDIYHLLHLSHKHILPCEAPKEIDSQHLLPLFYRDPTIQINSKTDINSMPSATGLDENRVKLDKMEADSFLEIKFEHRVLKIPYLLVDDHTETMFRNFIAFEQCCLNTQSTQHQFSAYVTLMDSLVNTRNDVELLRRAKIMEHKLGSDKQVALLFNRLNLGVTLNLKDSYLFKVFVKVGKHCNRRHNKWIADFNHTYFKSPWACLALLAAALGLSLTILTAMINVSNYARLRGQH